MTGIIHKMEKFNEEIKGLQIGLSNKRLKRDELKSANKLIEFEQMGLILNSVLPGTTTSKYPNQPSRDVEMSKRLINDVGYSYAKKKIENQNQKLREGYAELDFLKRRYEIERDRFKWIMFENEIVILIIKFIILS